MATSEQLSVGIDVGSARITLATWPQGVIAQVPCCIAADNGPKAGTAAEAPDWLLGAEAQAGAIVHAPHTAFALPRLLARGHDDSTIAFEIERLPTGRAQNDRGDSLLHLGGAPLWPEEALGQLLRHTLGHLPEGAVAHEPRAVLTIPSQFSRGQRQALSHAARIAGIKVAQLVAAPVASALAMAEAARQQALAADRAEQAKLESQAEDGAEAPDTAAHDAQETSVSAQPAQLVLCVDVGAGTIDAALVQVDGEKVAVHALGSAPHGGDAIDDALVQAVASDFFDAHAIDLRQQPLAQARLREGLQRAREKLTAQGGTEGDSAGEAAPESLPVHLPFIAADLEGTKHLNTTLTTQAVLACSMELIGAASNLCQQLLAGAKVDAADLHAIWLTGGLQHTSGLASALEALAPEVLLLPPDTAAQGAAVCAAVLSGQQPHPTLTVLPAAKAQAVPPGAQRGLTAQELQDVLAAQTAREAERARLQALATLKQRAHTLLANLSQSGQADLAAAGAPHAIDGDTDAQGDAYPGEGPLQHLHAAMAAVAAALEADDPSHAGHEHLHGRLQTLDIAAAQWQRAASHA